MNTLRPSPSRAAALAVAVLLAACSSGGGTRSHAGKASRTTAGPTATGVSSLNVSFTSQGTTTYGTLEMPAHASAHTLAAALLIPGSGPTDRNGNQPPQMMPDTLELIANVLGRKGIISLRFDKYFSGKTGAGTFGTDPGSITLQDFIAQAGAAYRFLSQQPEVDTGKLLVLGHSEGGMYALLLAESVTPRPAGLALMEPADQRLLDTVQLQIDEQLDAQVRQGQLTAPAARQNAVVVHQAFVSFRAGKPVSLAGVEASLLPLLESLVQSPINDAYDRSDDLVYPPAVAAKLPSVTRLLVTDGTADTKILPPTTGPLVTALRQAGTTGPGFRLLPNVNHDLFAGDATSGARLDPQVIAALATWTKPYISSF
jgi:pimeloyl-ACP methyl ester carboxylesterase